ncbi:MAG: sigma-70 family RNA polymerase sigma factor [Cyanobacteriota bacterium]|jgi:RNA polymerase sigma-B factor
MPSPIHLSISFSVMACTTLSQPRPLSRPQPTNCQSTRSQPSWLQQRNQRVETYRHLVRPLAVHYARCSGEASEDLVQVGLLGLIRAAERFEADRAIPFAAFARPHIRGAILHYLRDVAPSVRLPRRQVELQDRLQKLQNQLLVEERPNPTGNEMAGLLGVSLKTWEQLALHRQLARPLPLHEELLEELATPAPEPQEEALSAEPLLAVLEPRQRWVVRQVVLAGWSYRRLASQMEVSPMTVQRLLRRGLDRLRQHLDGATISPGARSDRDASAAPAC